MKKVIFKTITLFTILLFTVIQGFCQENSIIQIDTAKEFYVKGMYYLSVSKFDSADFMFQKSIDLNKTAEAFSKLALIKFKKNDTCGYCFNFHESMKLKKIKTDTLYEAFCTKKDTVFFIENLFKTHAIQTKERCGLYQYTSEFFKMDITKTYQIKNNDTIIEFEEPILLPSFPSGDYNLINFFQTNFKYPSKAKKKRIQGIVNVIFKVEVDGLITNVIIENGLGFGCDDEILRVIKMMPKWKPSRQKNNLFVSNYKMAIHFDVEKEKIEVFPMKKLQSLEFFKRGMSCLEQNEMNKAEMFFEKSNSFQKSMEAYYQIAMIKLKQNDSCSFCRNLFNAKALGDENAIPLYTKNCVLIDSIRQSIELPDSNFKIIFKDKCRNVANDEVKTEVEELPMFPGGEIARMDFLMENVRYPVYARNRGIQGIVYVSFIIEPNGQITNIEILRGIGGGCDEEVIRIVALMPDWIPGKIGNIPVRTKFNMPVKFVIKY